MTLSVSELRGTLVRLGDRLDGDVGKLAGALARFDRAEAMRYVTDAYPELVTPYLAATGDLTATWYEDQPTKVGAKAFFAEPAPLPTVEQLAANGRWSLTQANPSSALQGAGRRSIFTAHRDTVLDNSKREGVAWVREARPNACGFCRMLATRVLTESQVGAPGLYGSKRSARRNAHTFNDTRGHDFCRCIAVPLRRGGDQYTVPGYVHDWLDDYEAVSRDANGNLFKEWKIARLMEQHAARERGDLVGVDVTPKPAAPKIVDLDAGTRLPAVRVPSARPAPAGPLAIEAPTRQLALNRAPARLAIEAARQPKMLTAAPARPVVQPPDPGAIAEWLDAEADHWSAVEYWRRVDAENLHALPAAQAIGEPPAPRPPAGAEGPVDVPNDPSPVADVAAVDRAGETELDRAVREFEEAVATGDDALIAAAADAMDLAEQAEQLAATRAAARAAKAGAIAEAENERILAAVEAGEDPVTAEADVLIDRPSQQRKIRDMVGSGLYDEQSATTTVYGQVVERIRRRDFMAAARADGHSGKGFDDLLDSVFQRRVEELYIEAENATRGQMVKRQFALKFDPKRFWYCNDATARKYMSDELAAWFDENGRITRPVMRQMILDGSSSFDRYTATRADYLQ